MLETPTLKTEEFLVNMGPQHPSTHGVLRLLLTLDGEKVLKVQPHIGYLHRSCEKIAENRTYAQFLEITDRMDYLAAMSENMGLAYAVEKLMGIEIPESADVKRVIILELQRIASHLIWFGTFCLDMGAVTPFLYAFQQREKILDLFEEVCGARLTYSYIRVGGLSHEFTDGFLKRIDSFIQQFKKRLGELDALMTKNPIFVHRTKGVGCISQSVAKSYALSGPMLRSTGIKWDLRKDDPYSVYHKFKFDIPVGVQGDCYDRYNVRLQEIRESVKIIEQALRTIPDGPFMAKLPKMLKPGKGEVYARIESPRGEHGVYIVSEGGPKPYRLKVRAPSFCNLSVLPEIGVGAFVADIIVILGSIDIVLGDVDR